MEPLLKDLDTIESINEYPSSVTVDPSSVTIDSSSVNKIMDSNEEGVVWTYIPMK